MHGACAKELGRRVEVDLVEIADLMLPLIENLKAQFVEPGLSGEARA